MATTENNGLMIYQDDAGNRYILYPVTKAELVDGLLDDAGKIPAALLPEMDGGVGKDLEGETLSPIEGTGFVAETGAEIFNDYRERTFVSYAAANGNVATGSYSHAEGMATTAMGDNSHAEGRQTIAIGTASHAQGRQSIATDTCSHAEGNNTISCHENSHAEGYCTTASGESSHAEGTVEDGSSNYTTISPVTISDISGSLCDITGPSTLSQLASGDVLLIDNIPYRIRTIYSSSNRFSFNTTILFDTSVTSLTWIRKGAFGEASHVEGNSTVAKGDASHAEGYYTQATEAYSHAEGNSSIASGESSHAEGESTAAEGLCSHAEGYYTLASGTNSHAEGDNTAAMGDNSHAEGSYTTASGTNSHASGSYTTASGENSFVVGKYGVAGTGVLFGVGNGTSESSTKLAFEVRNDDAAYVDGQKVVTFDDNGCIANASGGFEGGSGAWTDGRGGAVGMNSTASDGFAGGFGAECINSMGDPVDCIQLGTGSNGMSKSLKVYSYMLMNADGTIPAERTATTSDARLKRDIADADTARMAAFVDALRVSQFRYLDSDEDHVGLVAQQVQEADAELAKHIVLEKEDGYLAVRPEQLVYPLIAAVQALAREVEKLKNGLDKGRKMQ